MASGTAQANNDTCDAGRSIIKEGKKSRRKKDNNAVTKTPENDNTARFNASLSPLAMTIAYSYFSVEAAIKIEQNDVNILNTPKSSGVKNHRWKTIRHTKENAWAAIVPEISVNVFLTKVDLRNKKEKGFVIGWIHISP